MLSARYRPDYAANYPALCVSVCVIEEKYCCNYFFRLASAIPFKLQPTHCRRIAENIEHEICSDLLSVRGLFCRIASQCEWIHVIIIDFLRVIRSLRHAMPQHTTQPWRRQNETFIYIMLTAIKFSSTLSSPTRSYHLHCRTSTQVHIHPMTNRQGVQ